MPSIRVPLNRGFARVSLEDAWVLSHNWTSIKEGEPSGPYAINRRKGLLHRAVMGATNPSVPVDHLNGDGLDCRRTNLRLAPYGLNQVNTNKTAGVTFHQASGKWMAQVSRGGVNYYLGLHSTREEALRARLMKEKELWGIQPRRERLFKEMGLA